jgi:protein-S-isoprenylcysteine O-methyltransferase Ste14
MRRYASGATSIGWFVAVGGTFGCLLPYLLGYWQFDQPLRYWDAARAGGALLISVGLVPVVGSFVAFVRAGGTPVPVASPPRLVVTGFYRYVRNPIYVGFLIILVGQALLFGSLGLLRYTIIAWCVGAAGVRCYEQPTLTRKFGSEYQEYRRAVRAWIPRVHPWTPAAHTNQLGGAPRRTRPGR